MRFFTCLIDRERRFLRQGASLMPETFQWQFESYPRRRGLEHRWQCFGPVAVLTGWDDPWGAPMVATHGENVAVGMVRLDNRDELVHWTGAIEPGLSDLELVLRAVAMHGTKHVPAMLGDFAFVVWRGSTSSIIAAVDAFAVKTLFYAERGNVLAFASRAEPLALGDDYDRQYLAERVAMCIPTPGLTAFAGVRAVSAGHLLAASGGEPAVRRYWSAHDFTTNESWVRREQEAAERCRDLLAESVRLRLGGEGETWAELSGGLDSSSVVSVAQWLLQRGRVPHGLAGTVSYVETGGTGADERMYSDAVAAAWGLRNEKIIDAPTWHDDEYAPPLLDRPGDLALYPRTQRLCAIVRGAGGKVLLTGIGGDNLFLGTMFFFADWLARGRVLRAVREMARRAALGRVSFWELAYRNALLPLLPYAVQKRLVRDEGQMPSWIAPEAVRRFALDQRVATARTYAGRLGHKYCDSVAALVSAAAFNAGHGLTHDHFDVRHPYLYRPLVELAIALPAELCVRPHARKWVLRDAMREILPKVVGSRIGKGVLVAPLGCALVAHRDLLEQLLRDPVLADLGVASEVELRRAFEAAHGAPETREKLASAVQLALSVEAWLRMRSDGWPAEAHPVVQCNTSPALTMRAESRKP